MDAKMAKILTFLSFSILASPLSTVIVVTSTHDLCHAFHRAIIRVSKVAVNRYNLTMHFEGITLHAILKELSERMTGAYVQKIHQPTPDMVILQLYGGEQHRLLISLDSNARIHTTSHKYPNPATPFAFCMLLRKHLTGAAINEIEQAGIERICDIHLRKRDRKLVLRAELTGNQGNLILIQDDVILGALNNAVGHRSFMPNETYQPLQASPKLDPFEFESDEFEDKLREKTDLSFERALTATLNGIGPQTARELLARAELDSTAPLDTISRQPVETLIETTREFFQELASSPPTGHLYFEAGSARECTALPYSIYSKMTHQAFDSISEALDQLQQASQSEPLNDKISSASKELKAKIKRVERAIKGATRDLKKAERYEELKAQGDLIMANLHNISKGMAEVELEDFEGNKHNINLDPKLNAVENAQALYKRYKKLKRGVDAIQSRLEVLNSELAQLEQLRAELESAETTEQVRDLELEVDLGPQVRHNASKEKPSTISSGPRVVEYKGYEIYVGRNGKQNDALIRSAKREDLWFHVKDRSGSHVVIHTHRNQSVPEDVIERAAELAAFYSRAQNATKADVMYSRIKNLKKPKGAKPGQVLVSRQEGTITVRPRGED